VRGEHHIGRDIPTDDTEWLRFAVEMLEGELPQVREEEAGLTLGEIEAVPHPPI